MRKWRHIVQDILVKSLGGIGWISPKLAGAIALSRFTTPRPVPHPGWERELMRHGRLVRFRGGTSATVWGPEGRRKALLVHGWNGRGAQLGKAVEPLLANGFQVIAWDAPAHGDSLGTRTNIRVFAEGLGEIEREIGPIYGVIAHSFGTAATAIAISKGWMNPARLVFAAAPASLDWIAEYYVNLLKMPKPVTDEFYRQLEAWVGLSHDESSPERLALSTPTLLAHDPNDEQVPYREAERLARAWKQARILALENVGHSKILKRPEFISAAVEFLSRSEHEPESTPAR